MLECMSLEVWEFRSVGPPYSLTLTLTLTLTHPHLGGHWLAVGEVLYEPEYVVA